MSARSVVERLIAALNAHDLDSLVECFEGDYQSDQPAHPERAFGGREQVRMNWSSMFAEIPDIRAELLRTAVDGDTCWAELSIHGNRDDGTTLDLRGVIIHGIANDRIAWARLYLEELAEAGERIDEALHRVADSEPD